MSSPEEQKANAALVGGKSRKELRDAAVGEIDEKNQPQEPEFKAAEETVRQPLNILDVPSENTIETVIIDETGTERTVHLTPQAIAAGEEQQARAEGKVPFNELPLYQQFLAETATVGVSPTAITRVGTLGKTGRIGKASGS